MSDRHNIATFDRLKSRIRTIITTKVSSLQTLRPCFDYLADSNPKTNLSYHSPSLQVPAPIPGTDLLAEWFNLGWPQPFPVNSFEEAVQIMRENLLKRLHEIGDEPIGVVGLRVQVGRLSINVREETEMTVNQTLSALGGLEIYMRAVNYRNCLGFIFTAASLEMGQSIGMIYTQAITRDPPEMGALR